MQRRLQPNRIQQQRRDIHDIGAGRTGDEQGPGLPQKSVGVAVVQIGLGVQPGGSVIASDARLP